MPTAARSYARSKDHSWPGISETGSEADTNEATVKPYETPNSMHERSSVLAAVGLSQSSRSERENTRRDPFLHLPRNVRDLIYAYMTVTPFETTVMCLRAAVCVVLHSRATKQSKSGMKNVTAASGSS